MAKILVIEDSPINMKLMDLLLHNFGHDVLQAVDAETGLALAQVEKPDLILMDIQLPGMDGLVATTILKSDLATASIPIIALTALAMKMDHKRIMASGCDAYIAKPLHYKDLNTVINRFLQEK